MLAFLGALFPSPTTRRRTRALAVAVASGYLRRALGNVSLLLMHWRVWGLRPLSEVSLEGSSGPRLAYALPIFAGLVTTLWLQ